MYKIILEKQVQKFFTKQKGQPLISQFEDALKILTVEPYKNKLDIKRITNLPHVYRLRIWEYRFLYEIIDKKIIITFFYAGSRWDIYKLLKNIKDK